MDWRIPKQKFPSFTLHTPLGVCQNTRQANQERIASAFSLLKFVVFVFILFFIFAYNFFMWDVVMMIVHNNNTYQLPQISSHEFAGFVSAEEHEDEVEKTPFEG